MYQFREVRTTPESLASYAGLFQTCFPTAHHLNEAYLSWLYDSNPDGKVVGFDAYDDGRLAAHYACIPVRLSVAGIEGTGLLSLNTATHPEHRGKGLFTKLANLTYERGKGLGYLGVYGVANANSTPGFTRKLGFTLVSPLEARIGLGPAATINWEAAIRIAEFRRIWDAQRITWRCRNPANPARITKVARGVADVWAATDKVGFSVWANVAGDFSGLDAAGRSGHLGALFLGLLPEQARRFRLSVNVPQKYRPSPLNFIYRPLHDPTATLDKTKVACSFIDFDAY